MPISAAGAFVGFVLFAAFVFGLGIREFSRSDCDKFRDRRTTKSAGPLTNTVSTPRATTEKPQVSGTNRRTPELQEPAFANASYIFSQMPTCKAALQTHAGPRKQQPKSLRSPAQIAGHLSYKNPPSPTRSYIFSQMPTCRAALQTHADPSNLKPNSLK